MTRPQMPQDRPPYADLESLAAGELDADAAAALQLRIAAEPAVAAAWAEVQRVEDLLAAETLLPLPVGFESRIGRAVRAASGVTVPARPWKVLARVAAAILVVVGSWFVSPTNAPAFTNVGDTPAFVLRAQDAVPTDVLPAAIVARTGPAVSAAQAHAPAMLMLVVGVVLLLGGLALLLRWHRAAAGGGV